MFTKIEICLFKLYQFTNRENKYPNKLYAQKDDDVAYIEVAMKNKL